MPASIDGIPFVVDPDSISWPYSIKAASTKTIGGKVIQLYGTKMGDLTLTGTFGRRSIDAQREWLSKLAKIVDRQMPVLGNPAPGPVTFKWPEFKWDFHVFVRSIVQIGAPVAIQTDIKTVNPKYNLTLFIASDNTGIMKALSGSAQVSFLSRLTAGMGWAQSTWSGPTNDSLIAYLSGRDIITAMQDDVAAEWNATHANTPFVFNGSFSPSLGTAAGTTNVGDGTGSYYASGKPSNAPVDYYDDNGFPVPVLERLSSTSCQPSSHIVKLTPQTLAAFNRWQSAFGRTIKVGGGWRPIAAGSKSKYALYAGHHSGEAVDIALGATGVDKYKAASDPRRQAWDRLLEAAVSTGWWGWGMVPGDNHDDQHFSFNGHH